MKYNLTPVRMTKTQTSESNKCQQKKNNHTLLVGASVSSVTDLQCYIHTGIHIYLEYLQWSITQL